MSERNIWRPGFEQPPGTERDFWIRLHPGFDERDSEFKADQFRNLIRDNGNVAHAADATDIRRAVWEWIGMQDRHRVWDLMQTLDTIGFPCPDDVRRP